jgi:hypothetical protein
MTSLREALGAALDGGTPEPVDTTPAETVVESGGEAAQVPETTNHGGETPAATEVSTATTAERVRDGLGRFVPKDTSATAPGASAAPKAPEAPAAPEAGAGTAAPPAEAPAPAYAPPVAWKAEAKAAWSALPAHVQAEVHRRETETSNILRETASARNIATQFTETVTPYLPFMRAEGASSPLEAIRNLMDVAVQLRTGTAFQKANTLAQLVKTYGVDIEALDSALVGTAAEDPKVAMQQQIDALVQQRMAPFQQLVQQAQAAQQAQQAAIGQEIDAELETFQQSRPHYQTVRGMMADLMEVAQRNNVELTLADAYDQALRLHPATKGVTIAAQTAQTAAQLNDAAQRAKRAAVSGRVQTQSTAVPAGGANPPSTLRGAIAQAMQDVPLA